MVASCSLSTLFLSSRFKIWLPARGLDAPSIDCAGCTPYLRLIRETDKDIAKAHIVQLRIDVMLHVEGHGGGRAKIRPTRYGAKLYHPRERPRVHSFVDHYLCLHGEDKLVSDTPILVSAFFRPKNGYSKTDVRCDVTQKIKTRILKRGYGNRLILKPCRVRGHSLKERWWYTLLLGDPCPRVTKFLVINFRHRNDDKIHSKSFAENTPLYLPLMAE